MCPFFLRLTRPAGRLLAAALGDAGDDTLLRSTADGEFRRRGAAAAKADTAGRLLLLLSGMRVMTCCSDRGRDRGRSVWA